METETKADLRQWENPKTWPMLQASLGPSSLEAPPPPSSSATGSHVLWAHTLSPPPSVCWSSVEQLPSSPASCSVIEQPRPASLHYPPLYSLLSSSPLASL